MQLYGDNDSKGLSKIKLDWEPRLIAAPQTAEFGSALWSRTFLTQVYIFQDVGRGTAPLQLSGTLAKGEGGQPVWKTVKLVFISFPVSLNLILEASLADIFWPAWSGAPFVTHSRSPSAACSEVSVLLESTLPCPPFAGFSSQWINLQPQIAVLAFPL